MRRYKALQKEWRRTPPIAGLFAAWVKYKPPAEADEADGEIVDGSQLAAMFGAGPVGLG